MMHGTMNLKYKKAPTNYCKLNRKKSFEGNEYIPLTMKNSDSWNVTSRSLINVLTLGRKLLRARAFLFDVCKFLPDCTATRYR
jgi:hypothetical protein